MQIQHWSLHSTIFWVGYSYTSTIQIMKEFSIQIPKQFHNCKMSFCNLRIITALYSQLVRLMQGSYFWVCQLLETTYSYYRNLQWFWSRLCIMLAALVQVYLQLVKELLLKMLYVAVKVHHVSYCMEFSKKFTNHLLSQRSIGCYYGRMEQTFIKDVEVIQSICISNFKTKNFGS